ncbi:unnamed protein product [Anisakis simplex]|uniref:ANK_REP_REGION domain-containing protein n=1 Tax=Anisakis simplex TaxID=6269 RepID=A0A3P6P3J4_ANISI|nr:unnamed protein product [Anisakis simplex]
MCVRLMSQRRHILYLAAAEGRFESIPAILSVIDNTHEKLDGYTPSQIAAKNNHMATVCELARYDISSIYDRSYIDGRSVLDGLFENLFNKMFTNSTNKDNIGIGLCLFIFWYHLIVWFFQRSILMIS